MAGWNSIPWVKDPTDSKYGLKIDVWDAQPRQPYNVANVLEWEDNELYSNIVIRYKVCVSLGVLFILFHSFILVFVYLETV